MEEKFQGFQEILRMDVPLAVTPPKTNGRPLKINGMEVVFPIEMVNFWGDMRFFQGCWVITYLLRLIIVVYWDYNPFTNHFLTSWDIHVGPLLLLMVEIPLYNLTS